MNEGITEENRRILKLLSGNNEFLYNRLLQQSPTQIERTIEWYRQREPVIRDLQKHGIKIDDLSDMSRPDFSSELYREAIPILVKWINNDTLPYKAKSSIIDVMMARKISKKYAFDNLIRLYKSIDFEYRDKWGYKTELPGVIANVFLRWTDDKHFAEIMSLIHEDKISMLDTLLLTALYKFKDFAHRKIAIRFLKNELQKPNQPNVRLITIIATLRKLKSVDAREIIYPFATFPKNSTRTKDFDPRIYGHYSEGDVRREAKKAIAVFDKLKVLPNTNT